MELMSFLAGIYHRKILQMNLIKKIFPKVALKTIANLINILPPSILDAFFDYPGKLGTEGQENTQLCSMNYLHLIPNNYSKEPFPFLKN